MKMKNGSFYLFLALTGLLLSCNIATTVHFNKDYSGSYTTVVDMSDLMSFAGMADTTGEMDQNQMIAEMRHSLDSLELADTYNSLSGISNAQAEVSDEGVVTIGFDFDNVESLSASFTSVQEQIAQKSGGMDDASNNMLPTDFLGGGDQMFKRDGKTIMYSLNSEGLGQGSEDGGEEMDMMTSMIDYTIDFSFDRKIKSVNAEGLTIVEKGSHIVKTRVDLANLIKEGKYSISVKTK